MEMKCTIWLGAVLWLVEEEKRPVLHTTLKPEQRYMEKQIETTTLVRHSTTTRKASTGLIIYTILN